MAHPLMFPKADCWTRRDGMARALGDAMAKAHAAAKKAKRPRYVRWTQAGTLVVSAVHDEDSLAVAHANGFTAPLGTGTAPREFARMQYGTDDEGIPCC